MERGRRVVRDVVNGWFFDRIGVVWILNGEWVDLDCKAVRGVFLVVNLRLVVFVWVVVVFLEALATRVAFNCAVFCISVIV